MASEPRGTGARGRKFASFRPCNSMPSLLAGYTVLHSRTAGALTQSTQNVPKLLAFGAARWESLQRSTGPTAIVWVDDLPLHPKNNPTPAEPFGLRTGHALAMLTLF